ncbi:MAG TPA: alpha/beta fold hydrolase, partial [Thermoleophilaceae bacterium]|nr:alpha/beta fold hydrolase [Thermoleophilaceae bacterium]
MEVTEHRAQVGGLEVNYRQAGDAPIVYLHGVPTHSHEWIPFLERTGGVAPDLPGFGKSAKPANFDYSIEGYDRLLEAFVDQLGLERFSLVLHDWGAVGLALAQRFPERVERLVLFSIVPFVPGFRWHRVARGWRTPGVGELLMGITTRWSFRRELPGELADVAYDAFDHGTQRAILKL